ncbi:MAG TPA: glycoside hydrolase family 6 protein [Conexibacter sp.]|nr:glycoside hydrolase family 6 protein [Conexibacter sp.]
MRRSGITSGRRSSATALLAAFALAAVAGPAHATLAPNPLGTAPAPPSSNPLVGARWFVDWQWGLAARQQRAWSGSHSDWARAMGKIAAQPEAKRFGAFTPSVEKTVRAFLQRAARQQPGTVPVLVIYRLKHVSCGRYGDSYRERLAYRRWIDAFARAVGGYRGVIFLEPDAIITVGCLSGGGLRTRIGELRYAGAKLAALPHSVVYLDAGAADALSAGYAAHLLRMAGIARLNGFFLNATHYDWTGSELRYGNAISRRVGFKHFVISTAANGNGPLVPSSRVRYGNEVLCNPPGRALGTPPTTRTGSPLADAYMWIGNPGRSSGPCHPGDPPNGSWFPRYALGLAERARF